MIEEFRFHTLAVFDGLPVFAFRFSDPDELVPGDVPPDVESWAWRVGAGSYEDPAVDEAFALFLDAVDTTRVRALILGAWEGEMAGEGADAFQRTLLEAADRFPALEALFVSDVPQNMSEISWIEQHDPGDLLAAFPRLRVFGIRGGFQDRPVRPFAHPRIEELVLQSGGLAPAAVRAVANGRLPALTSLELYLGIQEYGGGARIEDLEPILSGSAFPHLRHLGLRDAENADEIAAALAHAPITAQLETLDLSLGTLGDEGAAALLAGQPLTHLKRLDLHHHFMSQEMIGRLWEALPGVEVDVSEQETPQEWGDDEQSRYVAVSE